MLRTALSSFLLFAVVVSLVAPLDVSAKPAGAGFGGRAFHVRTHRGADRALPWVGGYASAPYYSPDYTGNGPPVMIVLPPPEPPYQLTCDRSWELVNVPSEHGGIREVRVTRC